MAVNGRKAADDALALALAQGQTVEQAARQAGVSQRTAYRRRDEPEFRRKVERLRAEMLSRTVGALSAISLDAVVRLHALMQRPETKDAVKLGAIRTILEFQHRGVETLSLAGRIEDIENRLEDRP